MHWGFLLLTLSIIIAIIQTRSEADFTTTTTAYEASGDEQEFLFDFTPQDDETTEFIKLLRKKREVDETTTMSVTDEGSATGSWRLPKVVDSEIILPLPTMTINDSIRDFLSKVQDVCPFLQHLSQLFKSDEKIEHFDEIQEIFLTKFEFSKSYKELSASIKTRSNRLWDLLQINSDSAHKEIEEILTENVFKNEAGELIDISLDEKFMRNLREKVENELGNFSTDFHQTTPNLMIYDFYVGGVYRMIKENAIFSLAAKRIEGNGVKVSEIVENFFKFNYRNSKFNQEVFEEVVGGTSAVGYVELQEEAKFIRFESFLQRLVNEEGKLMGSCNGLCHWISQIKYEKDGCFGEVRECKKLQLKSDEFKVVYSKNSSKIHEVYSPDLNSTTLYQYWKPDLFKCDICTCTCDQKWHEKTERFIYAGKIETPVGFVITGVRFTKENWVIFLQIQAGKLENGGYVDEDSVHWIKAPHDLMTNVHTLDYNMRKLLLNEMSFVNSSMTAIQIISKENFLTFKIFSDENSLEFKGDIEDVPHLNFADKFAGLSNNNKNWKSTFGKKKIFAFNFATNSLQDEMGQKTIPQFDAENVEFSPSVPAAGLGFISYTNDEKFGGFIKPYLINLKRPIDYQN